MGLKFEERSSNEIETTANAIAKAADQLLRIVVEMKKHQMPSIILAWAQRQYDAVDLVVELGQQSAMMAESQFLSHAQGRQSIYKATMERSAKKTRSNADRAESSGAAQQKKPRGRPKKKGA